MNEARFRGWARPGYTPSGHVSGGRWAPVMVSSNRFRLGEQLWHWSCRLECWARESSAWTVPTHHLALKGALEHLAAFHFPEPCEEDPMTCTLRHAARRWDFPDGPVCVRSHLRNWRPVTPLLHEQVTKGDLMGWRNMIIDMLGGRVAA